MPEPDELTLLRRVAARDRKAFEALYALYYRRLFAYVLKLMRRAEMVEEVVNDVMFAVWTGAPRFDGRSRPSTWIFGIAYHKALKALARHDRHKAEVEESDGDAPMTPMTEEGPDGLLARREMADVLGRALRSLPLEQRTVVELTYYHGFAYQEIAEIMG